MADALDKESESPDTEELEALKREASKLEAEVSRMSRAEAGLHGELAQLRQEKIELAQTIETLKGQSFENAGSAPSSEQPDHADPLAQGEALQRAMKAELKVTDLEEALERQKMAFEKERGDYELTKLALEKSQAALAAAQSNPKAAAPANPEEVAQLKDQMERLSQGAKEQVRTVTRYYERILARTPCGILVLAESGTILSINPSGARHLRVPATDLLRQNFQEVPALRGVSPVIESVLQTGKEIEPTPLTLAWAEGNPTHLQLSAGRGELGSRLVCVLVLDEVTTPAEPPPASAPDLPNRKEDLFALRMMIELLGKKANEPSVVQEVTSDLLTDLDRMLSADAENQKDSET